MMVAMRRVALPKKTGPKHGTFAFNEAGEHQIFEAVTVHGMSKVDVAAKCGVSLPTIYAAIRRAKGRLS